MLFISYILYASGFDSVLHPIIKPTWLYRIIQKILEGAGLYVVYTYSGIDWTVACLICHYFLTMDFLYYVFRNEFYVVRAYEATERVPEWLDRIYYSGRWVFQCGFTVKKFALSALAGIVIGLIVGYFHIISFIIKLII